MRSTILLLLLTGLTCAAVFAEAPPRNDYSKPETWLCLPGHSGDACATADLTTTIVTAQGKLRIEKWKGNPDAPIDCFYVYPTISNDPTANSDMEAGPEERSVILHQFARFGSQCKLYAPIYRQVTLTALRANMVRKPMAADRVLAYHDVVDAWNYYLEHYNQGRGFVLIGHSQGSGVLTQLIKHEIDGKPVEAHLISALLMGTSLPVPRGKDVGGAFQHIPLCRSMTQTGCVVAYASFRANEPPPKGALFGHVAGGPDMMAACVNPAAPGGGSAPLHAYLASGKGGATTLAPEPKPWVTPPPKHPIDTRFVSVPGLLTGECVDDAHGSYLAITVHGDPSDPRVDDIAGDVVANGVKLPAWGLHLIDANVVMGDLVALVGHQSKAYLAAGGTK
ncbi:MAG TPA: DUF3089 domain-containing protein [Bryobacteraceae bacterium]|jgi:hypothetical protein